MSDLPRYATFGLRNRLRAALRLDVGAPRRVGGAVSDADGPLLERVRAAIAGGPVTPDQVADAVEDGGWLAVTLGIEAPSPDVLGDVRAPAGSFWIIATGRL